MSCNNCGNTGCSKCERPRVSSQIDKVVLNVDHTTNELYVIVNGRQSNKIKYPTDEIPVDSPEEIILSISEFNQTLFSQAIPEDKELVDLKVNGVSYYPEVDFELTGGENRDILWISDVFPLDPAYTLTIYVI